MAIQRGFLKKRQPLQRPYVDHAETLSIIQNEILLEIILSWQDYFKGRLLDVGCGRRPYSIIYDSRVSRSIGIDVPTSPHSLDDVDVVASVESLPFDDESFDTILCTEVLEHVADVEHAWQELFRVLKQDGYLIVTTPFFYPEHESPHDYRRYTVNGLVLSAQRHGFRVCAVKARGGPLTAITSVVWCVVCLRALTYACKRLFRCNPRNSRVFRWLWAAPQRVYVNCYLRGWRKRNRLNMYPSKMESWISLGYAALFRK